VSGLPPPCRTDPTSRLGDVTGVGPVELLLVLGVLVVRVGFQRLVVLLAVLPRSGAHSAAASPTGQDTPVPPMPQ
jgi:hypothetical protein